MRAARHNARIQQSFGYTLGRRACVVVTLINVLAFLLFIFWWSPQYDSHLARLQRAYEPNVQDEILKISESKVRKIKIGGAVGSRNGQRRRDLSKLREGNEIIKRPNNISSIRNRSSGSNVQVREGGVSTGQMRGVYRSGNGQLGPIIHFDGDGHEHVKSGEGQRGGEQLGKQLNVGKRAGSGGGSSGSPVSRRVVKRNIIPFLSQVAKMVVRERDTAGPHNPLTRWIEQRCVHKERVHVKDDDENERSLSSAVLEEKEGEPVCPYSLLDAQSDLRRWHGHSVLIPPDMLLDFALNGSVPIVYEYSNNNDMIVVVERDKEKERDEEEGGVESGSRSQWLEGTDYFVGRRLVTAATLQKAYTDQIALMASPYHYLSALPSTPSGGSNSAADGGTNNNGDSEVGMLDPAAPLSLSSLTSALSSLLSSYLMMSPPNSGGSSSVYYSNERNGGEGPKDHSAHDNDEKNADIDGTSRQSSSSSSSHSSEMVYLINPSASLLSNPYSGHSRLFAVLSSLALLIKGKEVAVLGSLDLPFVEVALLTLGRASRVHSIDYRPIFSSDKRIIGHDALEFWKRLTLRARRSWGQREAFQQRLRREEAKRGGRLEIKRVESDNEPSESSASNRRNAFVQQEETHEASVQIKNQSVLSALRVENGTKATTPPRSSEYSTLTSPLKDFIFVDDVEEEDREEYQMLHLDSFTQRQEKGGTALTNRAKNDEELPESNSSRSDDAVAKPPKTRRPHPSSNKKKSPLPPIPTQPFDVVVAFSTFQHSGLGRYGDALDSFGDIKAMADAWSLLSEGGLLLLSVPVGNDCLVFNQYRVYGRRRLPLLLYGWEVVAAVGLEDRSVEELYYKVGRGSDSASRSYALSRAREQNGSVLTRIARLVNRVLRWIFSRSKGSQGKSVQKDTSTDSGGGSATTAAAAASEQSITDFGSDPSDHLEERYVSRWADGQCDGSLQNSPLFVLRKPVGGSSSGQANYPSYFKTTASWGHDGDGGGDHFDLFDDNRVKTNAAHRDVSGHSSVGDDDEKDDCTLKKSNDVNNSSKRGYQTSYCYLPSRVYGRRLESGKSAGEEDEFQKSVVKDSPTARIFTQKRTMKELRKIRGLLGLFPLFHRPR